MLRRSIQPIVAAFLVFLLVAEAGAQEAAPPQAPTHGQTDQIALTLPRDTQVAMVLMESVSSAIATKGQVVRLAVEKDVVIDGHLVIPRGTPGTGAVARLQKGVPGKKDGYLTVRPIAMTLADGTTVRLKENRTGEDDCGDMGPCWALFSIAAPLLPLALIGRLSERNEEVHVGKEMTLEVCSWPGTEAFVAHRRTVRAVHQGEPDLNPAVLQCPIS